MYNGVYTIEQYAYMHDTLMKWLAHKTKGTGIGEKLAEKGVGKLAIYGVRGLGETAYQDIKNSDVQAVCYIDRNAEQYGGEKDGLKVLSPEQLECLPKDCFVLVTPEYYFLEIMENLLAGGIPLEHIISISMVV